MKTRQTHLFFLLSCILTAGAIAIMALPFSFSMRFGPAPDITYQYISYFHFVQLIFMDANIFSPCAAIFSICWLLLSIAVRVFKKNFYITLCVLGWISTFFAIFPIFWGNDYPFFSILIFIFLLTATIVQMYVTRKMKS